MYLCLYQIKTPIKMSLKLNTIYKTTFDNRRLQTLVKTVCDEPLTSSQLHTYFSLVQTRRKKTLTIILLKQVKSGYIAYLSNYVFGIGEFVFITEKEVTNLETFNLEESKEEILFNQWRKLCQYQSIIDEFVHPLDKIVEIEEEIAILQRELSFKSEMNFHNKKTLSKRF